MSWQLFSHLSLSKLCTSVWSDSLRNIYVYPYFLRTSMDNRPLHIDRSLFHHIASGDGKAFTELFHHYFEPLKWNALKMLKSEFWAEEIAQKVFTWLWSHREGSRLRLIYSGLRQTLGYPTPGAGDQDAIRCQPRWKTRWPFWIMKRSLRRETLYKEIPYPTQHR